MILPWPGGSVPVPGHGGRGRLTAGAAVGAGVGRDVGRGVGRALGWGPGPPDGAGVRISAGGPTTPGAGVALDPGVAIDPGGGEGVAAEDGVSVDGLVPGPTGGGGDAGAGDPGLVPGGADPDAVCAGTVVGAIATPDGPTADPDVWLPSPPTASAATARTRFITPRARTRRARWAVVTALRALPWSGQ